MSRPILTASFFNEFNPSSEFWTHWGSKYQWSEGCVPLYEWEQILYIGVTSSFNGQIPNLGVSIVLVESEEVLLKNFLISKLLTPAAPVATTPVTKDGVPADPFAGLDSFIQPGSEESPLLLDDLAISPVAPPEGSELPEEVILSEESPAPDLLLFDLNPSTNPLNLQSPSPQTAPTPDTTAAVAPEEPALNFDEIFEKLRSLYKKSMILKVDGDSLIPWKWDPGFQPTESALNNPVSLATPSPFRIVQKTLKPYHGHVVKGEVQERFFDEWNLSEIPNLLTITPLIVNDQLTGMILAIGDKDINPKASLILAEKVAEDHSHIIPPPSTALAS